MQEFLDFANKLADASGVVIQKYYRNFGDIEFKSDETPVTIADKEAENTIRSLIKATYPDHGIFGEEFGAENPNAKYCWVIDPIDGTASFIIGRPIFGTLIALLEGEEPVLGVINQPVTNDRWVAAKGQGAFLNGDEIKTSLCSELENAMICTTGPDYLPGNKLAAFNNVAGKCRRVIYGGDCYNYGLLAAGNVDIIIESGLKLYDFAALIPIIKESGGVICDWNGNELGAKTSDVIVCANKKLYEQVIKLF